MPRDIILRRQITSNSIKYLSNTIYIVEVNSRSISQSRSDSKLLEKVKSIKLYNYEYVRDYITFSKTNTLLYNKATLLDLLDNSYLE